MNARTTKIIGVILLCLGAVSVCRGVVPPNYARVAQDITVPQRAFTEGAIDLHFKVWQKEDNIDIVDWSIDIEGSTGGSIVRADQPDSTPGSPHLTLMTLSTPGLPSTSNPDNGMHAVDVEAGFSPSVVAYGASVKIRIVLFLTSYNTIRLADFRWSRGSEWRPAVPDFGWEIGFPVAMPKQPGMFQHTLAITNDNRSGSTMSISNVRALASAIDYNDLAKAPIAGGLQAPDRVMKNGESAPLDIQTDGAFVGNFIYHTFTIGRSPSDPNAALVTAQHKVVVPPHTTPTMSQWGLIMMAVMIAVAGVIVVLRRRPASVT